MDEQYWADRFSYQVDEMLREAGSLTPAPLPPGYEEELDMARLLAKADFSGQSRVRGRLLLQLLDGNESKRRGGILALVRQGRARPAIIAGILALAAVCLLFLLCSPSATRIGALARLYTLFPGGRSPVHRAAPQVVANSVVNAGPTIEHEADVWVVCTAIGNFTYRASAGTDSMAAHFADLDEARASVPFSLHQPGYLPAGYSLRETLVTPVQWVFLFYSGPDGDIVLVQAPVTAGSHSGDVAGPSLLGGMTLTDREVRLVRVGNRTGSWVEGLGLVWQTDDTGYHLGGANMNLDEATRIAQSLE